MEDLIGDLTAVPQPIEVKLFSDDERAAGQAGAQGRRRHRQDPGVVDVEERHRPRRRRAGHQGRPAKAALEGVDPDDVTQMLQDYLAGRGDHPGPAAVPRWSASGSGCRRAPRAPSRTSETLDLRAPDGHCFPSSAWPASTPSPASRRSRARPEAMSRSPAASAAATWARSSATSSRSWPSPGCCPAASISSWAASTSSSRSPLPGLWPCSSAAVALVFLLLLFLYESFRVALAILATHAAGAVGGVHRASGSPAPS